MIANAAELEVAERNLRIFEETLEGLRRESQAANPALFPTIAQGYQRQIVALQADIATYQQAQSTPLPARKRNRIERAVVHTSDTADATP